MVPTWIGRSWEDGTRKPFGAAPRLIPFFRQNTADVLEVVGMTASQPPASPNKRTRRPVGS
jgi:hypothetical protein